MTRFLFVLALAAAPIGAAAAVAQTTSASAPVADEIVRLAMNADRSIAASRDAAVQSFAAELDADADITAAERRRPGLKAALRRAIEVELDRELPAFVSRVQNAQRELLIARLTTAELAEARDFFASPAGRHIIANMSDAATQAAIARSADAKPGQVAAVIDQAEQAAVLGGLRSLRQEDLAAVMKFANSPASRKLQAMQDESRRIIVGETEKMMDGVSQRVGQVVSAAYQRHMASGK